LVIGNASAVGVDLLEGIGADHRRGTWPVMATSGIESSLASAMAVSRLVAPGPEEARHTCGRPLDARHALGHEARALLVAGQHVVDCGRLADSAS
jgi:hypothetical protein